MARDDMPDGLAMIDTHAHILPGLDDGPPDVDAALDLAEAHVAAGVTTVATTSHIDHDFEIDARALAPARAQMQSHLDAEGIPLKLIQGAEIALSRLVDFDDDVLATLTLGDGTHLLVECPFTLAVADIEPLVYGLGARGFGVVLAHPERCPAFLREQSRVAAIVAAGALAQVTAGSLRGDFGSSVKRFAVALVRDGVASLVASDAHDLHRRPPGITSAVDALERDWPAAAGLREWLTLGVPSAIVHGTVVPARPAVVDEPRPGLLRRVFRGA